eukprot:4529754-Pyramimonas_sp.AAC.1
MRVAPKHLHISKNSRGIAFRFRDRSRVLDVPPGGALMKPIISVDDRRSLRGLRGSRTDFRCLFWNFREIARAVVDAGGT